MFKNIQIYSLLILIFSFLHLKTSKLVLPEIENFNVKILNNSLERNEFYFKNFSLFIPKDWVFDIENFLYKKEKEKTNKIIKFNSKNELSFGNLKIYKNTISDSTLYHDFFLKYIKKHTLFEKVVHIKALGSLVFAQFFIKKKNKYDLFSKSIYLGMKFTKDYIYQIFIFGSNDFNFEKFDKQAIQILSSFKIYNMDYPTKSKFRFVMQSIEVDFQDNDNYKILNNKENQVFSLQYLNKPIIFDMYYLGKINRSNSFKSIRKKDEISLFTRLTSISGDYNYVYNTIVDKKIGIKVPIYLINIFGLSQRKKTILDDQLKVYYFQVKNRIYKVHLWYHLLKYQENYDMEFKKIMMKTIKFL